MRALIILLAIGAATCFASCSKSSADTDPNANFTAIPDTGIYYIKTGMVTITSPDSTYSYDASKDFVAIYNTPTYYLIACNNIRNDAFVVRTRSKPHTTTPDSLLYMQLTGVPARLGYFYISTMLSNNGVVNLTTYNTNGIAADGSFTATAVGRAATGTFAFINTNTYTGTFDLKLNPK